MGDEIRNQRWGRQVEGIMTEAVRQATICKVRLLEPGVVEAVLRNNPAVCGSSNAVAFKKLRDLLMMAFVVREQAVEKLGPLEAEQVGQQIRERLAARFGDKLGG